MWSQMEICLIDDRLLSSEHCLSLDAEFGRKAGFLTVGYFERFAYAVP